MNINKLLKFSSDAGKLMLQSGGETYRVEETVSRICQSFDVCFPNCGYDFYII